MEKWQRRSRQITDLTMDDWDKVAQGLSRDDERHEYVKMAKDILGVVSSIATLPTCSCHSTLIEPSTRAAGDTRSKTHSMRADPPRISPSLHTKITLYGAGAQ